MITDPDESIKNYFKNMNIQPFHIEKTPYHPDANKYMTMVRLLIENYPGCYQCNQDIMDFTFYTFPYFKNFDIYTFKCLFILFAFDFDDFIEQNNKGNNFF